MVPSPINIRISSKCKFQYGRKEKTLVNSAAKIAENAKNNSIMNPENYSGNNNHMPIKGKKVYTEKDQNFITVGLTLLISLH